MCTVKLSLLAWREAILGRALGIPISFQRPVMAFVLGLFIDASMASINPLANDPACLTIVTLVG